MKNILIIGAHYDDTELGAGATAARHVRESGGGKAYKITLTNTEVKSEAFHLDISQDRAVENSRNACEILGITELPFTTAQYGELEYNKRMMQELESIISTYDIDTCFFHFNSDYNTDHVAAHRICLTASRHCGNILMYQSNPYITEQGFCPNVFFDVSKYIDLKREALNCYDKEHNRQGSLFETNIYRNKLWGYGIHCDYAEGFVAIKLSL